MNFLKESKTNWKYILIVVILAIFVGGGILTWQYFGAPKEIETSGEGVSEKAIVTIEGVVKGPFGHPFTTITNNLLTKDGTYTITSSKTDLDTNEDLIDKKVIVQGYVSEHERTIPEAGEFHKVKQKTIEVISYRITE